MRTNDADLSPQELRTGGLAMPFQRTTPFSPSMTRSRLARRRWRSSIIDGSAAAWVRELGQSRPQERKPAVMTTLYVRDSSGFRLADSTEVLERARALLAQRYRTGSPVLSSPALTRQFLQMHVGPRDYEVFGVLHLDNRHRLIEVEDLFRGSVANASVHPREVVKSALSHNAAAMVLFHNHPSGLSEPSQADELITRRLCETLALIDVRVLDHLIIAESIYSFAEHGLL